MLFHHRGATLWRTLLGFIVAAGLIASALFSGGANVQPNSMGAIRGHKHATTTLPATTTIPSSTTVPASTTTATTTTTTAPPISTRPFSASSAWNLAIPANPILDPAGPAMVAWLASATHPGIADLYAYGVPVWEADASTPKVSVDCLKAWGTCQLEGKAIPIPNEAVVSSGSDGAMVVVDHSTGNVYEFWQAVRISLTAWTTSWGGIVTLTGTGTPGQAVGAGVSRLAGVVRTTEITGTIDHALVFSTDNACPSPYRYPASKSDGRSTRPDCIPEGARVQLDPNVDVSGFPVGQRVVARALQVYGAYVIDNGGAKMAYIFEVPSGEANPYPGVGFGWDYYGLDSIPWFQLRVLRSWNGL